MAAKHGVVGANVRAQAQVELSDGQPLVDFRHIPHIRVRTDNLVEASEVRLQASAHVILERRLHLVDFSRLPHRMQNEPEAVDIRLDPRLLHLLQPAGRELHLLRFRGNFEQRIVRAPVRLHLKLLHPEEPPLSSVQIGTGRARIDESTVMLRANLETFVDHRVDKIFGLCSGAVGGQLLQLLEPRVDLGALSCRRSRRMPGGSGPQGSKRRGGGRNEAQLPAADAPPPWLMVLSDV
mmetsp:Transcript_25853/g.65641  ORF Transcript_25853/g.65641 Transcript_25853/m.65641 type:complete len:237 (+) Transcript_25853:896-1606(+)